MTAPVASSAVPRPLPVRAFGLGGRALPRGLSCLALVFGVAALGLRRTVSAVAIQERRVSFEDVCAALMRLGDTLVCPVGALLRLRAAVL